MSSLIKKFETDANVRARVVQLVSAAMAVAGLVAVVSVGFTRREILILKTTIPVTLSIAPPARSRCCEPKALPYLPGIAHGPRQPGTDTEPGCQHAMGNHHEVQRL